MNYFEIFWGYMVLDDELLWIFLGQIILNWKKYRFCTFMSKHSHVKMSKSQASWLLMRFIEILTWHNKIHTQWCKFWRHMAWPLKTFKKFIKYVFSIFVDLHILSENGLHCLWTSLCQVIVSIVTYFGTWHIVGTFLTSFGLLDIFWHLNIWHLT